MSRERIAFLSFSNFYSLHFRIYQELLALSTVSSLCSLQIGGPKVAQQWGGTVARFANQVMEIGDEFFRDLPRYFQLSRDAMALGFHKKEHKILLRVTLELKRAIENMLAIEYQLWGAEYLLFFEATTYKAFKKAKKEKCGKHACTKYLVQILSREYYLDEPLLIWARESAVDFTVIGRRGMEPKVIAREAVARLWSGNGNRTERSFRSIKEHLSRKSKYSLGH
jgi:hypothetical protein